MGDENEEDLVLDFDPNKITCKADYDKLSDVQQRMFRRYQYECSMSDEDRQKLREKRQKASIERAKKAAVESHREARRKEEEDALLKPNMKNVVMVIWEGFEEMVAVTTVDVLRAAGCNVVVVNISPARTNFMAAQSTTLYTKGSHGITLMADYNFELRGNASFIKFDAIVVPAGRQMLDLDPSILSHVKLIALLRRMYVGGKWVCGSCDAPALLFPKAYITQDRAITVTPGMDAQVKDKCKEVRDESVVVDGKMITCRGSGDAIEFALNIVAQVVDLTTSLRVAKTLNYLAFTAKLQAKSEEEKKEGEKKEGNKEEKK